MPTRVVDASAIAAIVFVEPAGDEVAPRLADCELRAPTIFGYELANICAMKMRRFPAVAAATRERYDQLSLLDVREYDVDHEACLELARRYELSSYDASYLWLSRFLHAELVTLDKKLARAAATA